MALEPELPPRAEPAPPGQRYRLVLALLVACAALVALIAAAGPSPHTRGPRVAFAVVAFVLFVAFRRRPVPILAVAVGVTAMETLGGVVSLPCGALLGIATFLAASQLPRRSSVLVSLAGMLALGIALIVAVFTHQQLNTAGAAVVSLVPLAGGWFVGDSVTERHRYLMGLAVQAERERRAEAEHARLEVREERVRIARELHDVVAHTLAVITVQAGVGRRLMDRRPEEAAEALRSIEEIGRTAQDELRVVLGLLRDQEVDGASLVPAPRLVDLKELVDTVRASGTAVVLRTSGLEAVPSPAMELTVYRVVQEALTNVVKHAPGAAVEVDVVAGPRALTVEVTDDGPPAARSAGGHGIAGMRERVGAFGGELDAGPRPGGGYRVLARLPVDAP